MFDWNKIIDAKAAEERYGKKPGTVRAAIKIGKFKNGEDCKKFGTTWVLTIESLEREYGSKNKQKGWMKVILAPKDE